MSKSLAFALASSLALVPPAIGAQPKDLPDCLKPTKTLGSVPVKTVETTLIAQAVTPNPACTFTPVGKPSPVIRGLW
jgi:hypothetical protein